MDKLDAFIGILITSNFNERKCQRDYWSSNSLLHHKRLALVMSRDLFIFIKKNIKFSKEGDKNIADKIWRVKTMCEIFKSNILLFGYFSANLSIDESMVKFFGRCQIKQFVKNKPIRFGIKLWSLCTDTGFLLDFNIYCGKDSNNSTEKLRNCTLGTRVVMNLLHPFLFQTALNLREKYHVIFDNFFTSPYLLVFLKTLGLRATGTVRANRVYEQKLVDNKLKRIPVSISLNNKSKRGDYEVKRDINSTLSYVSVKDSKVVSILSTAAGIEPFANVERYCKEEKKKTSIPFPQCFAVYNKYMGGVDLHDHYRHDLKINISSRRWTWQIFKFIIETALSNSVILWNSCNEKEKKIKAKEFALIIADIYLRREEKNVYPKHNATEVTVRRKCTSCNKKTVNYCFDCKDHFCSDCYDKTHFIVHRVEQIEKKGSCLYDDCGVRTLLFCQKCKSHVCQKCRKKHKQLL